MFYFFVHFGQHLFLVLFCFVLKILRMADRVWVLLILEHVALKSSNESKCSQTCGGNRNVATRIMTLVIGWIWRFVIWFKLCSCVILSADERLLWGWAFSSEAETLMFTVHFGRCSLYAAPVCWLCRTSRSCSVAVSAVAHYPIALRPSWLSRYPEDTSFLHPRVR